jgi:hypothetical protein
MVIRVVRLVGPVAVPCAVIMPLVIQHVLYLLTAGVLADGHESLEAAEVLECPR